MAIRLMSLALSASLHIFLLAALTSPKDVTTRTPTVVATPRNIEVVVVRPENESFPGLAPSEPTPEPAAFERPYSPLALTNATFDLDAIAKRAHVLFPFLSPGVDLSLFHLRGDAALRSQYVVATGRGPGRPAPPLTATPAQLQVLVDRAWSRRQRWQAVQPILRLADTYDANAADMPGLLRMYSEQNLGQYYEDNRPLSRDQRLWAELSVAADHVSFIGYIRRYVEAHPSTKSATELLFLLDKTAEGNRNILETLLSTEPRQHLAETQRANPHAYELAIELQKYYRQILRARGLQADADVMAVYDADRLEILGGIIRSTPGGYRANDARFLIGEIHWSAKRVPAAVSSWCQMGVDAGDAYVDTYRQILSALQADSHRGCDSSPVSGVTQREIGRILERRAKQSWDFQFYRLYKFGYRFDSF